MTQRVTGTSGRARFDVPDEWTIEHSPRPEVDALAYFASGDGTFAPNAVLTVNRFEGGIAEFAVDLIDNIATTLDDAYVFDLRAWKPGEIEVDDLAAAGRALSYTHRSPRTGARLRVTDWLLVAGGYALQLTTTSSVSQWPVVGPMLAEVASSLTPADETTQESRIPDSARDDLVSRLAEQPVERIHGLASLQPYPYADQWVHGRTLTLFAELAEGTELTRLTAADFGEEIAGLQELGFLDGWELSDQGDAVAEFFRTPEASIRITAHYGDHEPTFQAWVRESVVLIAAGTSYSAATDGADGGRPSFDHFDLQIRPVTDLTTLMGRWVGLQPAWNLPVAPTVIPEQDMEARWRGRGDFPVGASETMKAFWHENWFAWDLIAVGPEAESGPIAYINAGRMGSYRVGVQEGNETEGIVVIPTPSVDVFDQLEDTLQACLFGRQPVLV